MKTFLTTMVAVMVSLSLFAQEVTDAEKTKRREEARERIKAARVAYLTQRLDLTTAEAEKFWPVYREYDQKREAIMEKVKEDRASGKDDTHMLQAFQKAKQDQLDLEKSYSPRFLQILSAEKVLKLSEAERDFNGLVRRHAFKGGRGPGGKGKMRGGRK